jgi:hypothetical protein
MIKRIIGVLLLGGGLTVLCLLVFTHKAPPPQTLRLSDGTLVTFLGATYGTNHTIVWGKPHQRSLYTLLPPKWKSWSRATVNTFVTSNTNDPVFWLFETGRPTNAGYPAMRLVDEYGCELDPNGYSMGMSYTSQGGPDSKESVSHYQFDAPLPCGRIVGICIYDSAAKTQKAGYFLVPGSVLASPPEIKQPLSPPKPAGELTLQLTSLITGLKSIPSTYFKPSSGGLFTQATFLLNNQGKPEEDWVPVNIQAVDRNGQTIRVGVQHLAHKDAGVAFNFEGLLDPTDGPFKLRVELRHSFNFSQEELVTFKGVPFPSMENSAGLQLKAEAQGEQIILERAIGAFSEEVNDGSAQPGSTFFELTMLPATNQVHLDLIKALDEQGKPVSVNYARVLGKGKYRYGTPPGTKAISIDLTFAVHKSRFVEFEATPVLFSTNASPAR